MVGSIEKLVACLCLGIWELSLRVLKDRTKMLQADKRLNAEYQGRRR